MADKEVLRNKIITLKEIPVLLVFTIILALIGYTIYNIYSAVRKEAFAELKACENNIKEIAFQLECYCDIESLPEEKGGVRNMDKCLYPPSLNFLVNYPTGPFLTFIPKCPACNAPYKYQVSDDYKSYTLLCPKANAHFWAVPKVSLKGSWPQYYKTLQYFK